MITFLQTQKQHRELEKERVQRHIDARQAKVDDLSEIIEMYQECIDFIQGD